MKKQILFSAAIALAFTTFFACKKDPGQILAAVSESQVADLVESALQEEMAGLTEQIQTTVELAKASVAAQCGVTQDSVISVEKTTLTGSAEYETSYIWTLECEGDAVPLNFDFVCHSEGTYNNNRLSSNDFGDATWALTGLSESAAEFIANGNYSRYGEQTFKSGGTVVESNMDIVASNLTLDKTSETITGGSAEVNVSGKATSGEQFDFEGQIVFHGGGKATLTVNGKTFNLQI